MPIFKLLKYFWKIFDFLISHEKEISPYFHFTSIYLCSTHVWKLTGGGGVTYWGGYQQILYLCGETYKCLIEYMRFKYRREFFIKCRVDRLKAGINRLGSLFISHWHHINHNCINTSGQVVKINSIYTYKEGCYIDIVRLLDVYKEKGYLYCTLYLLSQNKIITVSQILKDDAYIIWRLMDNREFDEIMSRRLWHKVDTENELLEFNF